MEEADRTYSSSRKHIISLDINIISYQEAMNNILTLANQRICSYVCFANAHMTIEAHQSRDFQKYVNDSTFTFADGMPLVFGLKWLYKIRQERIAGMDFMFDLLGLAEKNQLPIYFFGSTEGVLSALSSSVLKTFPSLKIAGALSPPFRPLSAEENLEVIEKINSSGAQLVFVGLGCPKQETWMAKNSNAIRACLLGVGGAFEIYAGHTKRAPEWMQKIGLEWLYRLFQEPKRLFKRYARTNTLFVYYFIKQFLRISK